MDNAFGETVEIYTNTAIIQLQRLSVEHPVGHYVNCTIAPKVSKTSPPDFTQKLVIQLKEPGMANFAMVLMGLKEKTKVIGTQTNKSSKKSMYVNCNDNGVTNVVISVKADHDAQPTIQSINFYNTERYVLLRVLLTQLALNSTNYKQSVEDTIAILKSLK